MSRFKFADHLYRITHLAGDANYTFVHFTSGPALLLSKTMKVCLEELPDFIRIHKRYAINPSHLGKVDMIDRQTASVRVGDQSMPISRRRLKDVLLTIWMHDQVQTSLMIKQTIDSQLALVD